MRLNQWFFGDGDGSGPELESLGVGPVVTVELCPRCSSTDLVLIPIDDDRGMVTKECGDCGYESEPYVIYSDPLNDEVIYEDILDCEVIDG